MAEALVTQALTVHTCTETHVHNTHGILRRNELKAGGE